MSLKYEYATIEEAKAAIDDGTALAYFQPFIDIAVANIVDENRPYWKPEDAQLRVGYRGYGRQPKSWQVYLYFSQGLKHSWGQTEIVMRKDGTVNQENLNEIVWLIAYRRASSDRAAKATAANNNKLDALPERFRPYVKPRGAVGEFALSFREGGISFSRSVSFDEIVPILTALQKAASTIDGIRYPDLTD